MARTPSPSRRQAPALAGCLVAVAMTLAGCGSSPGAGAPPAGTVKVPAGALAQDGQITYCSDISAPPLTFYDTAQQPAGVEIELGDAIAAQLGVRTHWANTGFPGLVPALQAKQCDAIISQLYIKPEREKVVDFVPYMYASSALMVANGNTDIPSAGALCGKKAAVQTGTTLVEYLTQQSGKCTTAGKPNIDIRQFTKDSDALQQLRIGLVDAFGTTLETAAYVQVQQPGAFKLAGDPFDQVKVGIATRKDSPALHDALTRAFAAVQHNGTYTAALTKWKLTADDITR